MMDFCWVGISPDSLKVFIIDLSWKNIISFEILSYLWLIYIVTLGLFCNRRVSSVGSHSCHFLFVDNMVDLIDSKYYQRTMALAIEIYS